MSEASGMEVNGGKLQDFTIDQLAGALALSLGAVGTLLLVIWQSRCHCRMNLCYIFTCERRPPTEDQMETLKDQVKKSSKKSDKIMKKEDKILEKEDEILDQVTPRSEKQDEILDLLPPQKKKEEIVDLDEP